MPILTPVGIGLSIQPQAQTQLLKLVLTLVLTLTLPLPLAVKSLFLLSTSVCQPSRDFQAELDGKAQAPNTYLPPHRHNSNQNLFRPEPSQDEPSRSLHVSDNQSL